MYVRAHDGLTLAVATGLISLGSVMVYYTVTPGVDPGNLFFPLPVDPHWLASAMLWERQPWFGCSLVIAGLVYGYYFWWGGYRRGPLWLDIALGWGVMSLLWTLFLYRVLGFYTARNPPWWAIIWLGSVTLALTIRRLSDLYALWRLTRG